jgi:alanyl-tRNA synthetase
MIIRRAARFAYLLRNQAGAFLYTHTNDVVRNYAQAYPELKKNAELIQDVCQKEEEAFTKTIINGLKRLEEALSNNAQKTLSGEFAFDLYATYGFPLELTLDIAKEKGFQIDIEAYEAAKAKHSEVSNTGAFDTSVESNTYIADIIKTHGVTQFLGYDTLKTKARILAIEGNKLVLDTTPFYAESGGQLADIGIIRSTVNGQRSTVTNVKKIEGVFVHHVDNTNGLSVGDEVEAIVDSEYRKLTTYHHTTCHLLQAALRKVLGPHIQQMGSQVGAEYTRFDFNSDKAMTREEIQAAEDLMNLWISHKLPVSTKVMNMDEAVKAGALSFFEEKYDEVRVLFVADDKETASIELCGGTHVTNIGDIKRVVIAQEGSVAAGIRRIKMFSNIAADAYIEERRETEKRIAEEKLAAEQAKAEAKSKTQELSKQALAKADEMLKHAETDSGTQVLIVNLADYFPSGLEAEIVKTLTEALLSKIESTGSKGFVFLASEWEAKLTFIAAASADLVKDPSSPYNASNAVKAAAQICGGGGGGRPNFAQAGGKDPGKLQEAMGAISTKIRSILA